MSLTATVTPSSGPGPVAGRLTVSGTQQWSDGAPSGMVFPPPGNSPAPDLVAVTTGLPWRRPRQPAGGPLWPASGPRLRTALARRSARPVHHQAGAAPRP